MKIVLLVIPALLLFCAYFIFYSDPETVDKKITEQKNQLSNVKPINQNTTISAVAHPSDSLDELINQSFPVADPSWAWDKIDMASLEKKHPKNLYWELASPTSDELVLEQRKETRNYWEKEYGKVLSGTASKAEVDSYYSYQQSLIKDYLTITQDLLNNYSSDLPEQDLRLLNLAKNMQQSKLNDIPGHWKNSLEKSNRHEDQRQQWLTDKEGYEKKLRQQAQQASETYVKKSYN